jgi:hypothetical protein
MDPDPIDNPYDYDLPSPISETLSKEMLYAARFHPGSDPDHADISAAA